MMFFKLVLIFVIMTIQNSNSKTVEIPDDLLEQFDKFVKQETGKMEL